MAAMSEHQLNSMKKKFVPRCSGEVFPKGIQSLVAENMLRPSKLEKQRQGI